MQSGNAKPAHHRHALVETDDLHGDLTLVVIHGHHGIEAFLQRPEEDRVSRERPLDIESEGPGLLDRRLDDVDLFHAEAAAVAGMRIEPRNRNSRFLVAGILEAGLRQIDFGEDRIHRQVGCHILERDMRGHPRVPNLLENVEFTNFSGEGKHVGDEADLVVIAWIGKAHRLLVEGCEADGFGLAGMGEFERRAEISRGEGAAGKRRLSAHYIGRIEMGEIHEDVARRAGPVKRIE
ncbi:hypothetical protein ACVI55_005575 [Sinorhizobium medicae]